MPTRPVTTKKQTKLRRSARRGRSSRQASAARRDESSALLELTPTLFAVLDLDGTVRSCSGAWETCLQRPRQELIGRSLFELATAADLEICRQGLQRTISGHPADEFFARFPGNGRGNVWLALRPMISSRRDVVYLVARDVTAERQSSFDRPRLDRAWDELEEGVLVAETDDPRLPILHANAGVSRLSGYDRTELAAQPLRFLVDPEVDDAPLNSALEAVLRGRRSQAEVRCLRKDGSRFWARVHFAPVADAQGAVRQIIAMHADITEQRMVFEALREKNAALTEALESLQRTKEAIVQRERMHALGKMASGIVHDFNNLLAPILGFTELLLTMPELLEDREKVTLYLEKIRTAANDGAAVVTRLREFYRSRSDVEPPSLFSVQEAVEATLDLTRHRWRNEAQASGVQFEVETDLQDTPPAFGSASELRQALTNLVLNALDSMPGGGRLRLATQAVGNWICIQISDSGMGMSEETRRRCFEPFFTTKGRAGTGLGLAIVFGIVERLHGRVELQSVEGEGTTFTLWLPAARGDETAEAGDRARLGEFSDEGRALRIMVVDDEDLLLEVVSLQLLTMGHSVDCFTRPEAAIEAFYRQPYDLVITDRAMPAMSGDQLAAKLREFKPDTPVVLLTGFGTIIKQHGERLPHIAEVLSKPLSQQTLQQVVSRFGGRIARRTAGAA